MKKAVIVNPISLENIESTDSPFGQKNRYRMMIYMCVTDPGQDFAPKQDNTSILTQENDTENYGLYMDKEQLESLKYDIERLLVNIKD
jgi:hypothetical protein